MRILIQEAGGKPHCIILPNMLLMNRLTASIAAAKFSKKTSKKTAKKDGEQNPDQIPLLTSRQLNALFSEIRRVKKMHRGENWYLVEVQDSDGDTVKIKL